MSLPKRIRKSSDNNSESYVIDNYIVIGGGIAGVSCAQELYRVLQLKEHCLTKERVILVVESSTVKCVSDNHIILFLVSCLRYVYMYTCICISYT